MITPFRRYEVVTEWVNQNTGKIHSSRNTINLFEVKEWWETDNAQEGFDDNVKRTTVSMYMGQGSINTFRIAYRDFDRIMTDFLHSAKLLDDESMPDNKKKVRRSMYTYEGEVLFVFVMNKEVLACNVFPYGPLPTSQEEAYHKVLTSSITTFN